MASILQVCGGAGAVCITERKRALLLCPRNSGECKVRKVPRKGGERRKPMLRLKGNISINRFGGGRDDSEIQIEIGDEEARVQICTLTMSLHNFAECVTGLSHVDCSVDFNNSGKIGTIGESKEEMVPIPPYDERDSGGKWIKRALAPFTVDGWSPRDRDITNHHGWARNKDGQEFQRVVFFRNVPRLDPDVKGKA